MFFGTAAAEAKIQPPPAVAAAIARHFPGEEGIATAVFRCESEFKRTAVSPTNDHGVAQIHFPLWRPLFKGDSPYNIDANLRVAKIVRNKQGWGAWTCARRLGLV